MKRVFLSYSVDDEKLAKQLARFLREYSFYVWDNSQLEPGENWRLSVANALDEADAMVVLVSHHSVKSPAVRRDIEYALGTKRFEGRLVPVLVGERTTSLRKDMPWALKHLNVIASSSLAEAGKQVAEMLKKAG